MRIRSKGEQEEKSRAIVSKFYFYFNQCQNQPCFKIYPVSTISSNGEERAQVPCEILLESQWVSQESLQTYFGSEFKLVLFPIRVNNHPPSVGSALQSLGCLLLEMMCWAELLTCSHPVGVWQALHIFSESCLVKNAVYEQGSIFPLFKAEWLTT